MAPGTVDDAPLRRAIKNGLNGVPGHHAADILQWHLESENILLENSAIRQAKIIDLAEPEAEPQWTAVLSLAGSRDLDQLDVSLIIKSARKKLVKQQISLGRKDLTVPKQWKVVAELPLTKSGSVDERALKQYITAPKAANAVQAVMEKVKRIRSHNSLFESPPVDQDDRRLTQTEQILSLLWGHVLNIDLANVRSEDSFIRKGGDSITAIELAALAHQCGISISVATIVQNPRLCDMAAATTLDGLQDRVDVAPFSMLPTVNHDELLQQIRQQCELTDALHVEDAYPCTPFQEGLMLLATKEPKSFISRRAYRLPAHINVARFKDAWERTVSMCANLRTRIVMVAGTSMQAVMENDISWDTLALQTPTNAADDFIVRYGARLCRYALVQESEGECHFVLVMHHAIFDGWTVRIILDVLHREYYQPSTGPMNIQPYSRLIKYTQELDRDAASEYWKSQLEGAKKASFPPSRVLNSTAEAATRHFKRTIDLPRTGDASVLTASILRAAWAIILGRYCDTEDICFCTNVSGRQAPVPGLEAMVGPTVATVPVRLRLDRMQPIASFLQLIQEQAAEMIRYEQFGMLNIAKLGPDAKDVCDFSSIFVIQPALQMTPSDSREPIIAFGDLAEEAMQSFFAYPLLAQVQLQHDDNISLFLTYDSDVLCESQIKALSHQFEHVVQQLLELDGSSPLGMISVAGSWDLGQALEWNEQQGIEEFEHLHGAVHERISDQAKRTPAQEAIYSSGGSMTYLQLEFFSTKLAIQLRGLGLKAETIVPFCFEKSPWAIVAMLGIMKAGGAFLPIDPSHPYARRKAFVDEVDAEYLVVSPAQRQACENLAPHTVELSEPPFDSNEDENKDSPALKLSPTSACYLLFTSGSTGKPKGTLVEHGPLCSSLAAQAREFAMDKSSRTFQFASYTFDASILETFGTLMVGGTVCVPTEEERLYDTASFITQARVNFANLTPSMARTMQMEQVPTLKKLVLGGELAQQDLLYSWCGRVELLINTYGPTEASIWNTAHKILSVDTSPRNIGRGFNSYCWIVDADNHQRLAPIGCIGELVLHSYVLARGYLNQEDMTRKVFLDEVDWLPPGATAAGDRWRFYKTGDLARYLPTGDIEIIGRRDSQVKFRGRRIELHEIESAIKSLRSNIEHLAVELVSLKARDTLVAFVCFRNKAVIAPRNQNTSSVLDMADRDTKMALTAISNGLKNIIPAYMIPSLFLPISSMPFTASLKVDRNGLRALAQQLTTQDVTNFLLTEQEKLPPTTSMELRLQGLWAQILKVGPEEIGKNDSFLQIGGDSISAIHLASLARESGVNLPVASIFQAPRLCDMALAAVQQAKAATAQLQPFSLLPSDETGKIIRQTRQKCALQDAQEIEDVYPCSALQEGLMGLAIKDPGSYLTRRAFQLPGHINVERFKMAWEQTVRVCANLRTRIVMVGSSSFQVVLKDDVRWELSDGAVDPTTCFGDVEITYGSPLCLYALVQKPESAQHYFLLSIHHAIYDGWTVRLMMDSLRLAYDGETALPLQAYVDFIDFTESIDFEAASDYWRLQLQDAKRAAFPLAMPVQPSDATARSGKVTRHLKRRIALPHSTSGSITKASILRATWAILLACYCDTDDICFGMTVSGRQASVPGIEMMAGPTIATVPVRLRIDRQQSIAAFLEDVQAQASEMIPFEQFGVRNIARLSQEAREACDFTSRLIIQPSAQMSARKGATEILQVTSLVDEAIDIFSKDPLLVQVGLLGDEIDLMMTYDLNVLAESEIQALSHQFEHVARQLASQGDATLGSISVSGLWDLEQQQLWNSEIEVENVQACIHDLIVEQVKKSPNNDAIYSTNRTMTYMQLDKLTTLFARHLNDLGVVLETVVPFCFEKSVWTIVAMVGILKAGGAFLPLDPSNPFARRKGLVDEVGAHIVIVSPMQEASCEGLAKRTVVLSEEFILKLASSHENERALTWSASPSNSAYVLFTSGSTGKPKGILMHHSAAALSLRAHAKLFDIGRDTRVLEFAHYVFDVNIFNILGSLISGCTICVPTEEERLYTTAAFMEQARVNLACFAPSFARTINPNQVPSLKKMVLGGEALAKDVQKMWCGRVKLFNAYGPTEAAISCTSFTVETKSTLPSIIGKGFACDCYVVDPNDHDRLMPIGCVGELLLHGHNIARGYINNEEITRAVFLDSVEFLPQSGPGDTGKFYKTGDLVKYTPEGDILYLGRKDRQVKIRGRRIEIGEIEATIKSVLPETEHVAVDLISLKTREALIAFICFPAEAVDGFGGLHIKGCPEPIIAMNAALWSTISRATIAMKGILPSYMVPSIFIPMRSFPFLQSLKLDRKKLRTIPEQLTSKQLSSFSLASRQLTPASTPMELAIRDLWAEVLKVNPQEIGKHDSFLQIGGDSISAIHLASLAQENGIELTVAQVFEMPQLDRLAAIAKKLPCRNTESPQMHPFSQLPGPQVDSILLEVRQQCELSAMQVIEDVFPCTPLQEGLMALAEKRPGSYVAKQIYRIPSHIDVGRFKAAWDTTVELCSSLRTKIAWVNGSCFQVLLGNSSHWEPTKKEAPRAVLAHMEGPAMRYGKSLCRYALSEERDSFYFVVVMHHAVFDGWTVNIILTTLYRAYHGQTLPPMVPFANFVKHAGNLDHGAAMEYWAAQLDGAERATFPSLQPEGCSPGHTMLVKKRIPLTGGAKTSITKASILRAAWAIVLARYCSTHDVCFGATVAGRLAPVNGVSDMAGPTMSTVPVRVRLNGRQSISNFLQDIQNQSSEMVAFEQFGLQRISKVSGSARAVCDFTSLFLVQPAHKNGAIGRGSDAILEPLESEELLTLESADTYFNFPLVLQGHLHDEYAELHISYQSNVLSEFQMDALSSHFNHVVQQLLVQDDTHLSEVSVSGPWDLEQVKYWHSLSPNIADFVEQSPLSEQPAVSNSMFWIVEPNDPQRLAPVGCEGELVIQELWPPHSEAAGDNSDVIFAAAERLGSGDEEPCRLRKTGDSARYEQDGRIVSLGKMGSQIKYHGQRLQLHEVEKHVKQAWPTVQHAVSDVSRIDSKDSLVVFIVLHADEHGSSSSMLQLDAPTRQVISQMYDSLEASVATHMIPDFIIPLREMLLKTPTENDLNALHSLARTLTPEELLICSPRSRNKTSASTDTELKLRTLWAQVLGLEPEDISNDDSFLQIGGDSISAIQLVSLAQKQGLNLTVPMVFKSPRLRSMAESAAANIDETVFQAEPFSLLDASETDKLKSWIQNQCGLSNGQAIADAYPCTALQEGLMALTVRQPGSYVNKTAYRVAKHVDTRQLKLAWERTVMACSNLRTRIVLAAGCSVQAIIWEDAKWETSVDDVEFGYGLPLCRYALTKGADGNYTFALAMHHAIYDAWTMRIVLDAFTKAYSGKDLLHQQPYAGFIKYTLSLDHAAASLYWTNQLEQATRAIFPPARSLSSEPQKVVTRLLKYTISLSQATDTSVTRATIVRAAWALVLARHCETDDICFGTTVSGRQAPVSGLDQMAGPMIATMPVRVRLDRSQPVTAFLEYLQSQASQAVAYEQFGLQNISKLNAEAKDTCDFSSLLIVQPAKVDAANMSSDAVLLPLDSSPETGEEALQNFFNYPLVLQGFISEDEVELVFAYDADILSDGQVQALSHQFEHVVQQLTQQDMVLEDMSLVGPRDIEHAIQSNRLQEPVNSCTQWLIRDQIQHRPNDPAINSWDRDLTYAELGMFAGRLAMKLQELGVGPETIVPICFPKSAWAIVAMVAVQFAGGAFVPLDPNSPGKRLQSIVEDIKPPLVLAAPTYLNTLQSLTAEIVLVDENWLNGLRRSSGELVSDTNPDNLSVVLFTSGSTGKPKGVMLLHKSICSSADAYGLQMGIGPGTRVFQFSAYTFDVAVLDVLVTLIRGGCICVPSEEARLHDLAGAFNATKANWVFLTPTVADLLDPAKVPGLKTLCLGGEAVGAATVTRWEKAVQLYGGYGPAESSICSWNSDLSNCSRSNNIGRPLSSAFWVVEPSNVRRLVPVGCVGELVIQGPLLARGYLNADEIAASKWLENVGWFPGGLPRRAYRTGDLVRRNADGSFDYVGRNDTQVKYHGQRMETGEIEYHVAAAMNNVEHVVVDVIRHGTVESLVAFVSFSQQDDQSSLSSVAAVLMGVLPTPMIPTYFIPVDRMPVTVSGKLDRLALRKTAKTMTAARLVSYSRSQRSVFRDCTTEVEVALRGYWSHVLDIPDVSIGVDDNFYHLGGDSIRIVTLAQRILNEYGVTLGLSLINSKNTTIASMAKLIEGTKSGMEWQEGPSIDLKAEFRSIVNDSWDIGNVVDQPITEIPEAATVFLTGATGYLGTDILRQLLRCDSVKSVVVLVRATSPQHGVDRVRKTAEIAGWWQPSDLHKLEVWVGDLAKPNLGLDAEQMLRLRGQSTLNAQIDAVIHNGAVVNWNADYDKLRGPNVDATITLLRAVLCSPARPKFVYVSGGLKESDSQSFEKLAEKLSSGSGYSQTKIMAERVVLEVAALLPAEQNRISVVKPGLIIGAAETGVANVDDFLWRAVATGVALQAAPLDGEDGWLHVAEVDHVAATICKQISAVDSIPAMVEMLDGMYMSQFWNLIGRELAIGFSALNSQEWVQRATRQMNEVGEHHPLWAARHFLTSPDAPSQRPLGYEDSPKLFEAVRSNVRYLVNIGFIRLEAAEMGNVKGNSISRSKLERRA